jgi:hypothetical protein
MEAERELNKRSLCQVVETFRCCVCLGFVRPGQRLRCCAPNGHLICNDCYKSMKTVQEGGEEVELACPLCRVGRFDEEATFATLKAIFDVVKNFIVYDCQGVNWGCQAKLSASQLAGHEAGCPSALSICPATGCNYKAPFPHLLKHGSKCFTQITDAKNSSSFFVWRVDVGGKELLDSATGEFYERERGFKPAVLCSQDPAVKVCLLTSTTKDGQFFTASVLWLQDNHIPKTRKEKRFVSIVAKSCNCNGQKFTGEAAFQNWDESERRAEGRQLKIHLSTFSNLVKKCLVCNISEEPTLVLQVELIFPKK